jgi:curved DNA-binding protein CbpA
MATAEQTDRLSWIFQALDGLDYFALLGIARGASDEHDRQAFHEFALKYHPDQWLDDPARHAEALTIFKRGTEAYRVLTHPVLRDRYEQALLRGELRLHSDEMYYGEETTINTAEFPLPLGATALYDKAVACLEGRDFAGAKLHLTLAKTHGDAPQFARLEKQIDEQIEGKIAPLSR